MKRVRDAGAGHGDTVSQGQSDQKNLDDVQNSKDLIIGAPGYRG